MVSTTLPAETQGTLILFNLSVKEIIHQKIISQLMVESSPHALQLHTSSLIGGVVEASSALLVSSPGSIWGMVSEKQHTLQPVLQLHQ